MFYPSQDYAPIGSLKARYRPLGLVAQGQFGKVYCAVHRASGRLVALKLLDRQRSTTSQFLRELNSLLTLSHPALVQLRAIEQTDSGRCLVLDYCAGGTLRQLLESPVLPRRDLLLQCLVQILAGLAHAHDRGIVHCDVKPENILMQLEPQGWRACLTDFGIAQSQFGDDVPSSDPAFERGGSPAYMAPERFAGEAYRASDLYSMGIIVYEVLLGDRPFHGSPTALREAHRQEPVKFSQPLDITFQRLLYRALSKSPDLRYDSAQAMALELSEAMKTLRPQFPPIASARNALFALASPEAILPWPEQSLPKVEFLPWDFKRSDRGSVAGISPLVHIAEVASPVVTQQSNAGQPAAAPPLLGGALQPQLWLSYGLNLQGISLESSDLDSGAIKLSYFPRLTLPGRVQDLALGSGYGFALTDTALYRWPLISGTSPPASLVNAPQGTDSPPWQCLIDGQADLGQVLLSPQGHWAAVTQRCSKTAAVASRSPAEASLLLLNLSRNRIADSGSRQSGARELKLRPFETLAGAQLLDRRHGAALISGPGADPQRLGLFSRRGQWLNDFTLPVALSDWVRGISPYELWAVEAGHAQMLLKLGLKPFRIQRIPVAIAPDQIHPLPWGCVLANQAGEILLLNGEGQSLGQLQVPLPKDCQKLWSIPISHHRLMVAMQRWQGLQLFSLDLRQLDLMLVF